MPPLDRGRSAPPARAETLHAALLGLARPTAPWIVREAGDERCDLVVAWRLEEPGWCEVFAGAVPTEVHRVLLLLDETTRSVRALVEGYDATWTGDGVPHLTP